MTNPGPTRGWTQRRAKAESRRAEADDEVQTKRAARQALYDQQRQDAVASALAAAEREKLARCSCPVCDGAGPIDVELAGRVITAMAKLPAFIQTDPAVVAALEAVVRGRDVSRASIYPKDTGLRMPRKVYANAPAELPKAEAKRKLTGGDA